MKKVIAAFLCSAWLMLGGATGESGQAQAQEKKLTDITFSLDFITLGRHAPFYVAIDKGYYKEEGLNVNIIPAKGTAQGIQNVESGIAQIGFTDIASLVVARAEGSTVKAVAVIYQKAPFCFFSLDPGANVTKLKDFEGLNIKVNEATAHLDHRLSAEQLDFIRTSLREQLASDPMLVDLVKASTGSLPPQNE